jgi:hypothetical protein
MSYALLQREREQPLKKGQCLGSNDMRDVRMYRHGSHGVD